MRTTRCLTAFALVAALSMPAFAQGTGSGTSPAGTTATTSANDNDRDFDWGWLGLIGLAGLLGMRRQPDSHRNDTTRPAAR